jgi:hypothetical protein
MVEIIVIELAKSTNHQRQTDEKQTPQHHKPEAKKQHQTVYPEIDPPSSLLPYLSLLLTFAETQSDRLTVETPSQSQT